MRRFLPYTFLVISLVTVLNAGAQETTVSGTIVAADDNSPLPGVTVTNRNTDKNTLTNAAGYFSIPAARGHLLVFTYVGYERSQISVGGNSVINVKLTPSDKMETVVTVYGTKQSKRQLGYLAQEVKGEDIAQTRRENFINSLAGRVAGANITPTSGVPGSSTSIVLRGAVSIGGNNQPLFVVDGVPFDNQTMNQENLAAGNNVGFANRSSDYGNRAMDINPEDIETVTILKGPEATALYGSDGASGVIVITTRKGKSGKGTVNYNNSFRWEKVYRFPETQRTYMRGTNGVAGQNATVNPFSLGELNAFFGPKYKEGTTFYDNFDAFFGTGFTQNHNMNVEGGTDVATYRLSANYVDQEGMVPNTGYDRVTVRFGGNAKLSPKFNINSSMVYITSNTAKASKGIGSYYLSLLNFPADLDARNYQNPDGSRKLLRGSNYTITESDNPFWDINKNTAQDQLNRFTGNFTFNFDPFKWLNISYITGIDVYAQTGDLLIHPQSRYGASSGGFYSIYEQNTKNWNNVAKAIFRKSLGAFSNTVTLGFSSDDNSTKIESQRGEQFTELNYKSINNTAPTSHFAKTAYLNTRKTRLFANYNLGYNSLLYLSLSGSREGNSTLMSRFIDKDPYFNFGAASFSFVFTDLHLFKNLSGLSYGKARISYGTTGKGPLSPYIIDYTFQSQITTGGGYAYGTTGNNVNLKPEFTKTLEFGGELKFLNNRLSIDATSYVTRSKDQILAARSSYGTGFIIKYFNGGLVENKGLEIVLNASPVKSKNFNWDFTVNFDRNRGKILEMPADLPSYYDSDTWVFGNLRSQAYKGAFTGNLSGFSLAKNTNGEILISPTTGLPLSNSDFVVAGDRQPDFKFGFVNNLTYKNLSLSFNLDTRIGGDVFNGNEFYLFLTGLSTRTLDRENPVVISGVLTDGLQNTKNPTRNAISITPYYRSDYFGNTAAPETDFIERVNWVRLRDATLAYRIPRSVITRQKVFSAASVFITVTDLFMITNYTGADPSVNANTAFARGFGGAGIDYGSLATPRGINLGCKVQF
ncbi:MAG: SusC/RagA family TonB-linked outer membrane protein [Chitinophagaceae bacterium]